MLTAFRQTTTRAIAIALAALTVLASAAAAQQDRSDPAQPTPIPNVPLVARNGTGVHSGQALPQAGRWLLVHVQSKCGPCGALLARIQGDAWAPVVPRLVIVVSGATAADVDALANTYPALEQSAWYGDEAGRLAATLRIQEAPVVIAVNDRGIQWTLAGVLSGSKRMQDVLTAWVATAATPPTPRPLLPGAY